ncbi:double-strand break repair helicase AddA [Maricaulis sp.]|uniref:double-strand break repair helicase AddA n=1 Tax=Maricaulis sp. TaxID=1486257 RepID=UPI0025C6D40C|nr:double-strand break repair helicase AddA [Maricaulis sp.]
MSEACFDPAIKQAATAAQQRAARPEASVFVEANAGSGKTRVLVDRVINLLLAGHRPETILCVTYTKAAAAEMKDRLFKRLGDWSVTPDAMLDKDLSKLLGRPLKPGDANRARKLFAQALETPGGLKIQTIHAFCENLLRRFPLEAGAPPGFETLDDAAAGKAMETARRAVLAALTPGEVNILIETGGPEAIDAILRWARGNRHDFSETCERAGGVEVLVERLWPVLELPQGAHPDQLKSDAVAAVPRAEIEAAAHALCDEGSKTDVTRGEILKRALASADPALAFDTFLTAYFTDKGKGSRIARLATAAIKKACPHVLDLLEAEAERLETVRDLIQRARLARASAVALVVADRFIRAYGAALQQARALDFDDLVRLAGLLLAPENPFSGWVGYKLDGMLAHALIDEAQDTAPRQWDMIRGLTAEFFAGEGAQDLGRTLFVVGDEKQSIYSFQGAEPARFLAEGDHLAASAAAVELPFERPGLDVSFRSAPEILAAVDQAFAARIPAPETKFLAGATALPFARYQRHRAARSGMPGCVEIWPAIPKPERVEEGSIFDPVDQRARGTSRDLLAATVATEIADMITRGDAIWEEAPEGFVARPVRPSDIAILVWRRTGGFFEEVIRQLKLKGVPVAGADRMVLREQTAVKDMLALGRFAMTPGDDLALAELLRSPLFDPVDPDLPGVDEQALYDLARSRTDLKRRGTLWNALFTSEDARFADARQALIELRNQADKARLYDLFAGFLNARTPTGETRWARMYARLGEEARDPLQEFLARALQHERESGGALASFIARIDGEETQIKREMSPDRNEVQVMTVHASKGLERPVIILPDTTRSPLTGKMDPIFSHDECGLLWSPRKAEDPAVVERLRTTAQNKLLAEHGRLLYVALTRARDRLIVCGWRQGQGDLGQISDDSWYAQLAEAWQGEGWESFASPVSAIIDGAEDGLRFGPAPVRLGLASDARAARVAIPDWAEVPARAETGQILSAAPSSLVSDEDSEPAVLSPLADPGGHRYRRGNVIHKLLQTLPDLPADRRDAVARRFVAAQPDIPEADKAQIVTETLAILDHPDFAPLFGPGSRAEVALVGQAPGLAANTIIRGQVDRLVVTDHEVLIIDYKTNRPPPADVAAVAKVYLGQMATYRALLRAVHPEKSVRCALLWTDAARLMALPDAVLDDMFDAGAA